MAPVQKVQLPPQTDCSIPTVSDYWKPEREKRVPKPTEKARQNVTTAYVSAPSPNAEDFIEVHQDDGEVKLGMTANSTNLEVPTNQREAYQMDKERWVEAEKAELRMLEERETWELVPHLIDRHVIRSQFTYAIKTTGDGAWYKAKAQFIHHDTWN